MAWQLSIRQFTSVSTCRAACHLAECILRFKLVSQGDIATSLEAVVSVADLYGPALLTDASSAFLSLIVRLRSSENSTVHNVAAERVLQWLQGKWAPSEFNFCATLNSHELMRLKATSAIGLTLPMPLNTRVLEMCCDYCMRALTEFGKNRHGQMTELWGTSAKLGCIVMNNLP